MERSLLDCFVEAFNSRDVDGLLVLFHEEAWVTSSRIYGKSGIGKYWISVFQELPRDVRLRKGFVGQQEVAFTEHPGRLGGIARGGHYGFQLLVVIAIFLPAYTILR